MDENEREEDIGLRHMEDEVRTGLQLEERSKSTVSADRSVFPR